MTERIILYHGTDRQTATGIVGGDIGFFGHRIVGQEGFAANLTPQLGEAVYWAWLRTWGKKPITKKRAESDPGVIIKLDAPVDEVTCVGPIAWSHGQSLGYIPVGHDVGLSDVPNSYLSKIKRVGNTIFYKIPKDWIEEMMRSPFKVPSWYR